MEGSLYEPAFRLKETILLPGAGAKLEAGFEAEGFGAGEPEACCLADSDASAVSIVHTHSVTAPISRPALVVEEEHIGMIVARGYRNSPKI